MPRVLPHIRLLCPITLVIVAASAGAITPGPAHCAGYRVEDFTTTRFRDPATTAIWDTVAGRVRIGLFQPSLAGGYDTPGSALGVARVGTLAYVADGASGLEIFDVSNPANVTLVGSLALPGTSYDVVVRGTTAYVACGTSGLKIVDVANPASPSLLGTYASGANVRGLAITGNTALLACDTGGLRVVSVVSSTTPTLLGTLALSGVATSVAVSGLSAYVATGTAGIAIVSFANAASPGLLGVFNSPGNAVGVAVTGHRVYVADGSAGVEILDASNPAAVSVLGTFASAGPASGVAVQGTLLYVAADAGGLQVVNVSDPANPALLNACDTPGSATRVTPVNDLAFVADATAGLSIVRIGTLQRPRLGIPYRPISSTSAADITAAGNYLYAVGSELQVLDASNHSGPTLVGSYLIGGGDAAMDVAVSGPRAYLAVLNGGLRVVNITNPASPVLWGSLTGFTGMGVAVSGSVAYVAAFTGGLKIVSASNPASMTLLSTYDTPGEAYAVALSGAVAYVADGSGGLQVINVSNTSAPALLTSVPMPGQANQIVVSGSLAFVGTNASGVQIVDISAPSSAHIIGTYSEPYTSIDGMAVSGSLLYACAGKLHVVDVSNPATPVRLWSNVPGEEDYNARDIVDCGAMLYVADPFARMVQPIEVVQQRFDTTAATAQWRPLTGGKWFDQTHVAATSVDSIAWQLSVDGGGTWNTTFESSYFVWSVEARDLRWRGTLLPVPPSVTATPPELTSVSMGWDHSFGLIDSLWDVPNDQGGKVRMRLTRSLLEQGYFDPQFQVTGYQIYHRIDDAWLAARILGEGAQPDPATLGPGVPAVSASSLRLWQDRTFVQGGAGSRAPRPAGELRSSPLEPQVIGQFPPGLWEALQWLPAFGLQQYYVLLPTTVDSTLESPGWSAYFTAALTVTPGMWFASPPESAQSVDNLAPNVPTGFVAGHQPGGNDLHWSPSSAADFRYFKVYRGSTPGFTPGPAFLVHSTIGTAWLDSTSAGGTVYYQLTAVDFAGNESAPASTVVVTGTDGAVAPPRFALRAARPNPFHGVTAVPFDVPAPGGRVEIAVYDIGGRRVRSLVDSRRDAGEWRVTWDGRDAHGNASRPGVYFVRMRAPGFEGVVKVLRAR